MTTRIVRSGCVGALLLCVGIAAAADPKTALGRWMKPNMGAAFAQDPPDFATLQTSYSLLLTKEPPAATYPQWHKSLQDGLAAAKAGDKSGVKASCKGCHDAHKEAYRADANVPKTFP